MILWPGKICFGTEQQSITPSSSIYKIWEAVGKSAADTSLTLIKQKAQNLQAENLIALTNAGYAEVNGSPTQAMLDGITAVTGVSRGRNTLVEVHSAPWTPLWLAVYDKGSGYCAYLEAEPAGSVDKVKDAQSATRQMFTTKTLARIDAAWLFAHPTKYRPKFGGNAFRIVSIANAVAAGAPADAIRAFEFHDHYCPGVTSGILMARYVKNHFPPGKSGYFVHTVSPWCKEDALVVLLNATPGKKDYAVCHPTDADMKARLPEAQNAATIIYRQDEQTKAWEGLILNIEWGVPDCPKSGNALIDKLCSDLWYLKQLDHPEKFVKVLQTITLPKGVSPKDWARPGLDPLEELDMVRTRP